VRIVLYVEGDTEKAIRPALKVFLDGIADEEGRPKVRLIPRREAQVLKTKVIARDVARDLDDPETLGVVLLVDVNPTFRSAAEAKAHYSGCGEPARFKPHCALHDFEAWLLPYWERV
jgi:hypothetical protein